MKKIFLSILTFCAYTAAAFAFEKVSGDNITINDTVKGDLYVTGGTVTINAPVLGDLIIAGGTLIINDSVAGDILLGGGQATFNGNVADDIRCAGGKLFIKGIVGGQVVVAGGDITIDTEAVIDGLMLAGGSVTFNGTTQGQLICYSGNLVFNGVVNGKANIRGGSLVMNGTITGETILSATEITIGSTAVFNNTVRYWTSNGEIDFKKSLKNGPAVYDPSLAFESGRWEYLGFMTFLGVLWYIGMAFCSLLAIQYLFGKTLAVSGKTITSQSWKSFGYGFLFFVGIPVIAVIAIATLIGLPLGGALLLCYLVCLIFATSVTSLVITHWLMASKNRSWGFWRIVFISLGIFILLKIVGMIPFAGWIAGFVIICFAFGALILSINFNRRNGVSVSTT